MMADLLVQTSLDQPLLILKIYIYLKNKQEVNCTEPSPLVGFPGLIQLNGDILYCDIQENDT